MKILAAVIAGTSLLKAPTEPITEAPTRPPFEAVTAVETAHDATPTPAVEEVSDDEDIYYLANDETTEELEARMKDVTAKIKTIRTKLWKPFQKLLLDTAVLEMPSAQYAEWTWKIAPILARGFGTPLIQSQVIYLFKAHTRLRAKREKSLIPDYRTLGRIEKGAIVKRPRIEYHSSRSLLKIRERGRKELLEREAHGEKEAELLALAKSNPNPKKSISMADAKAAQRYLQQLPHIDWTDVSDGCYLRCGASKEALLALGLDEKKIFVAHVEGGILGYTTGKESGCWGYHIAIGLELANGSKIVLDPALSPKGPKSVKEWAYTAQRYGNRNYKVKLLDRRREEGATVATKPYDESVIKVELHPSNRTYTMGPSLSELSEFSRHLHAKTLGKRVEGMRNFGFGMRL